MERDKCHQFENVAIHHSVVVSGCPLEDAGSSFNVELRGWMRTQQETMCAILASQHEMLSLQRRMTGRTPRPDMCSRNFQMVDHHMRDWRQTSASSQYSDDLGSSQVAIEDSVCVPLVSPRRGAVQMVTKTNGGPSCRFDKDLDIGRVASVSTCKVGKTAHEKVLGDEDLEACPLATSLPDTARGVCLKSTRQVSSGSFGRSSLCTQAPVQDYLGAVSCSDLTPLGKWEMFVIQVRARTLVPVVDDVWVQQVGFGAAVSAAARASQAVHSLESASTISSFHSSSSSGSSHSSSQESPESDRWCPRVHLMHPNARRRLVWDILASMLLLNDIVLIPMLAFTYRNQHAPGGLVQYAMDWFATCFWTCDILVSFLTGYVTSIGTVELDIGLVARRYVTGFFPIDCAMSCLDWMAMVLDTSSSSGSFHFVVVRRILRVVRLFRVIKLKAALADVLERTNSEHIITLAGVLKLMCLIIILNHYIACGWYFLSQNPWMTQSSGLQDNWAARHLEDASLAYAYLTCLHWSLTQFTPASMEVTPTNEFERAYNVIVIILAMVSFSSFVSSITNAMTYIGKLNDQKTSEASAVRRYLHENKISPALTARVWFFLRMQQRPVAKHARGFDIPALRMLPESMRAELQMEISLPKVWGHAFFSCYSCLAPSSFSKLCMNAVREGVVRVDEDVFANRSTVDAMVFVTHGQIRFFDEEEKEMESAGVLLDHSQELANPDIVNAGEWFAEVALWASSVSKAGVFSAVQTTEITSISAVDLKAINLSNLEFPALFMRYAKAFVKRFVKECYAADFRNRMCNSPQVVEEMMQECSQMKLVNPAKKLNKSDSFFR